MSRKLWLGFGGVQIKLAEEGGRSEAVTFSTASGKIYFEPIFRYNTTDIDYKIRQVFLGYRVVIKIDNLLNAWSGEYEEFQTLIAMINKQRTAKRLIYRWSVIPKYATDNVNYEFADMLIEGGFHIDEPERFACYQETAMEFVSRNLIRHIPNLYTGETPAPPPFSTIDNNDEYLHYTGLPARNSAFIYVDTTTTIP